MNFKEELQNYLDEHIYQLDEDGISRLARLNNDPRINNVLVGLADQCFGLMLIDDKDYVPFQLFYVNGKKQIEGVLIKMQLLHALRNEVLFGFSRYIAQIYSLDSIEVFNTFQDHIRSTCEHIGFFTLDAIDIKKNFGEGSASMLLPNSKGLISTPMLQHTDAFEAIFGKVMAMTEPGLSYVYLMYNKRNHMIKIGRSKNPVFREKTLQADEPDVMLITYWEGNHSMERFLHKKFEKSRKRGEWFDLSFLQLKEIKKIIDQNGLQQDQSAHVI